MTKKRGSSSTGRAPAGRGTRQGTTRGGSQIGSHPTRPRTRTQTNPQPEVVSGVQPRVVATEQVQEQVVQNAPPTVPAAVPTVALPADAVMRLLNVLEALMPNHSGLPAPQTTSQEQVQLNAAATRTPQPVVHSVGAAGQPKDLKNFMDLKPPEFDATPSSIEPLKFIDRCEKILTTLGLKETRGVEFTTFLFSGSAEAWWTSIQKGRQAGLPPISWSEFLALFKDRFIPLSKQDDMRRQFNNLRQGSMTVTEYEAKFTELSRYVPFLVADPREKVRRFVDGLEHRYRGPVIRDVRNGSYADVVDTALRCESYSEMEKVERESKKARNTGGFNGTPSGDRSGFHRGQSRPSQSESVVQSSRSGYSAKQGQQQMQKKGNRSFQSGQYPQCSNYGRNHSGRCFGVGGPCFTCGEKGHIAKFCPKGDSGTSQTTSQVQRNVAGAQTQIQPARAAPQGARGQSRQGGQVTQGTGGPPRLFAMARQDIEAPNAVVTDTVAEGETSG